MVRDLTSYSLQDCIRDGLIRKIPKSTVRYENSLIAAEKWLIEAKTTYDARAYNASMMCAYLTMFHSSRSILYRDGYREKSHYCVARYLETEYATKGPLETKWIDILDHYRETRHRSQYDINLYTTEEEAKEALDSAGKFLERIKKL
jgi:uncharacterized protein (UPF0332 family)